MAARKRKKARRRGTRNFFSREYVKWRKTVYARDNWRCQWPTCGLGTNTFPFRSIEAHHIHTWAYYPNVRFNVNNGIVLCKKHHRHVTGCEDDFIDLFQNILKKRGVWSKKSQEAAIRANKKAASKRRKSKAKMFRKRKTFRKRMRG